MTKVVKTSAPPIASEGMFLTPAGANDALRINSAIKAASEKGGGTVYLGPGKFSLEGPITLQPNVHLVGSGMGITQLLAANPGKYSIITAYSEGSFGGVRIADLMINGLNASAAPILTSKVGDSTLNSLTDYKQNWEPGELIGAAVEILTDDEENTPPRIYPILTNTKDMLYIGGTFLSIGATGLASSPPPPGTRYRIITNGIALYGKTGGTCCIENVFVGMMGGCGIYVAYPHRAIIRNNRVMITRCDGIRLSALEPMEGFSTSVINNYLHNLVGHGIQIDGVGGFYHISGNELLGVKQGSCGIKAYRLKDSIISQNRIPSVGTSSTRYTGAVTSADAHSIYQEGATWVENMWVGFSVKINLTSGKEELRYITRNTSNRLFFDHEPAENIKPRSVFSIHHYPRGGVILMHCKNCLVHGNIIEGSMEGNREGIYLGNCSNILSSNNLLIGDTVIVESPKRIDNGQKASSNSTYSLPDTQPDSGSKRSGLDAEHSGNNADLRSKTLQDRLSHSRQYRRKPDKGHI